jgi:dihydroorotase
VIEGLRDGTIDAIATDHAPHDSESKRVPMDVASYGVVGLETMLPLALGLVQQGKLTLREALAKMTFRPADIIHVPHGRLKKGALADLVVIDLNATWTVQNETLHSKSKNSPFDGRSVQGRAIRTIMGGETVFVV